VSGISWSIAVSQYPDRMIIVPPAPKRVSACATCAVGRARRPSTDRRLLWREAVSGPLGGLITGALKAALSTKSVNRSRPQRDASMFTVRAGRTRTNRRLFCQCRSTVCSPIAPSKWTALTLNPCQFVFQSLSSPSGFKPIGTWSVRLGCGSDT
jgi:hypothetical protein